MPDIHRFFATTAKHMEPLLGAELSQLGGVSKVEESRAGVFFEGTLEAAYRACLWSRIANRVLLPLRTFPAPTPEKLYGGVKGIKWSDHLTARQTLAVDFSASRSEITHTHYGALKVKDAVCDQFRSNTGERPSVAVNEPDIRINVYINDNTATVSLDLSGESLHARGYREQGALAPLKENLAAAILAFAGWEQAAAQGASFLDPMCGSGTLPIEAALIAARRAPGLSRRYFGFLGWQGHVPALWQRIKAEAEELQIRDPKKLPPIVGYDEDFRAVRAALGNVERAGMRGFVHIEKRALADVIVPATRESARPLGVAIVNPPYGERLGEVEELKPLYEAIGDTFKQKLKGWNGFVFTGSPDLAKVVGLKASRRYPLFNGPIECRLLRYELY
jgi:23S rRNA (guanine2445-N2)-methyltransferase / 23S rRNA (guanine2069-N7)-methyltransferase